MQLTILRKIALALVAITVVSAPALASTVVVAHPDVGTAAKAPASARNSFFPESRTPDFQEFSLASNQSTCGGQPVPLLSADSTYQICVNDELRTIHPDDLVAYRVKVSVEDAGRKQYRSQFSLVSPVGVPVMHESAGDSGYLDAEGFPGVTEPAAALKASDAVSLSLDAVGRSKDGRFIVQAQVVAASRVDSKAYETNDGRTFWSEDGNIAKETFTSVTQAGEAMTYHVGQVEVEVTVVSLPRL